MQLSSQALMWQQCNALNHTDICQGTKKKNNNRLGNILFQCSAAQFLWPHISVLFLVPLIALNMNIRNKPKNMRPLKGNATETKADH